MNESKKISGLRRAANSVMGMVHAAVSPKSALAGIGEDHHRRIIASGHVSIEGADHFAEGGLFNRIGECPKCRRILEDVIKTSDNFCMKISYDRNPATGCVQLHVHRVEA